MKPETRRLEKRILRKRRPLERLGARLAIKALKAQVPDVRSLESVDNQIDMISTEPVAKFFKHYYGIVGKAIGVEYFKLLQKADNDLLENIFLQEMEYYAMEEAGANIVAITETSKRLFRDATKKALLDANEFGLGVEKTKDLVLKYLQDAIKPARARAIAQTELIRSSNVASVKAAEKTGLAFKKYWSTSGLADVRDSHQYAEAWSLQRGGIGMNERFDMGDGTYMLHPGDPAGGAANVINCHCTILMEPV